MIEKNSESYLNWLRRCNELGLTNEQTCGAAMIYYWSFVWRKDETSIVDEESFWGFSDQEEFGYNKHAYPKPEDFSPYIDVFRNVGVLLGVNLPERYDDDGKETKLLDFGPSTNQDTIGDKLFDRHIFDVELCAALGSSLRPEIREPKKAFAVAEHLSDTFYLKDVIGFHHILQSILERKSPWLSAVTTPQIVKSLITEPAIYSILANLHDNNEIDSQVWNISKAVFYNQQTLEPINTSMQYMDTEEFIQALYSRFEPFVLQNKDYYMSVAKHIGPGFNLENTICLANVEKPVKQHLSETFGFIENGTKPRLDQLVENAAALKAVALFLIKTIGKPMNC